MSQAADVLLSPAEEALRRRCPVEYRHTGQTLRGLLLASRRHSIECIPGWLAWYTDLWIERLQSNPSPVSLWAHNPAFYERVLGAPTGTFTSEFRFKVWLLQGGELIATAPRKGTMLEVPLEMSLAEAQAFTTTLLEALQPSAFVVCHVCHGSKRSPYGDWTCQCCKGQGQLSRQEHQIKTTIMRDLARRLAQ